MKRLLVDSRGDAIRTALMDGAVLKEIFVDHKTDGSQLGQIILGTVQNILPSQFAFIDIGQEKNAFMNLSAQTDLKTGQPILVQVQKDATGTKGPNVSERLHLNGRLTILFAGPCSEIGVSLKITDKKERDRLRRIAEKYLPEDFDMIVRTNSAGKDEEAIAEDIRRLVSLYNDIQEKAKYIKPPAVLHYENPLFADLLSDDIDAIIVNDESGCESMRRIVAGIAPILAGRVYWHDETNTQRLFDAYNLEAQIERALQSKVWLPCGGFVIFEQTEACVIVDVNTGKFPGKKNYRESVLQTNLEAAACIAEQILLRNMSGMIIVDFIDMYVEEDKKALIRSFTAMLKKDRIKTAIVGMTELGLVQLTRKKTREPLSRLLECECPHCNGKGRVRKK